MINPYYIIAAFVALSIYNISIYMSVGWANVSFFVLQVILFALFLIYGGTVEIKKLHRFKPIRRLIYFCFVVLPALIVFGFIGDFIFLPLFAYSIVIILYILTNTCPHCDHFLKSGPKDTSSHVFGLNMNLTGYLSPINPPNCLNCGNRIDYK